MTLINWYALEDTYNYECNIHNHHTRWRSSVHLTDLIGSSPVEKRQVGSCPNDQLSPSHTLTCNWLMLTSRSPFCSKSSRLARSTCTSRPRTGDTLGTWGTPRATPDQVPPAVCIGRGFGHRIPHNSWASSGALK